MNLKALEIIEILRDIREETVKLENSVTETIGSGDDILETELLIECARSISFCLSMQKEDIDYIISELEETE